MKAFKPDGVRWFARSAVEVMNEWLESAELLDWLGRAVPLAYLGKPRSVFRRVLYGITETLTEEQQIAELGRALMGDREFMREIGRLVKHGRERNH